MRNVIVLLMCILCATPALAQKEVKEKKDSFLKEFYNDFLKYGTIYGAGDIRNSYEPSRKEYFVRTNDNGSVYSIPQVVDGTEYNPFDYRIGFGIRKLARFDYERKPGNFWTGNADRERQIALSAPTSAVKGFEYLFHWEKERNRGDIWTNSRYFLRHTGKYHIVKLESREQGAFDFKYQSAEVRARLPIGKKFSLSAGAMYRTHDRAYGYNPFEVWVNEEDEFGNPMNPWYTLGYDSGYTDQFYTETYIDEFGNEQVRQGWFWQNEDGERVADSDLEFRDGIFRDLINDFNNGIWDEIGQFGLISPVVGFDFYHYSPKFWAHVYGNYLLPYHTYLRGDDIFNYGNRDNWGKGGLRQDSEFEQWEDFQFGANIGWKVGRKLGIFVEGEYTKMWDTEFFYSTFGLNYTFR
jgi:hypothetical protein